MTNSDKLIEYVYNIIKTRDPNSIKEIDVNYIETETGKLDYSDIVHYWKNNKDDEITKEYNNIKISNIPNIMGIFTMFYLKGKDNFLTVGKFNGDLFHLDVKCKEYSEILNQVMDSDKSLFLLSYWIF